MIILFIFFLEPLYRGGKGNGEVQLERTVAGFSQIIIFLNQYPALQAKERGEGRIGSV